MVYVTAWPRRLPARRQRQQQTPRPPSSGPIGAPASRGSAAPLRARGSTLPGAFARRLRPCVPPAGVADELYRAANTKGFRRAPPWPTVSSSPRTSGKSSSLPRNAELSACFVGLFLRHPRILGFQWPHAIERFDG